jgi:hypothetical protein
LWGRKQKGFVLSLFEPHFGGFARTGEAVISMKVKKMLALFLILAACAMAFAGCGKSKKKAKEEWAYPHDTKVPVLSFYEDGTARFKKKDYKRYEIGDNVIKLFDENDAVLEMVFVDKEETRYLLEKTVYHYNKQFGEDNTKLQGVWESDDNYSFEFTEKGTFLEDGVLPGYYYADEEKGTIRLVYNDPVDDAVLYYSLENGDLIIEYPWPLVKAEK